MSYVSGVCVSVFLLDRIAKQLSQFFLVIHTKLLINSLNLPQTLQVSEGKDRLTDKRTSWRWQQLPGGIVKSC